MPAVAVPDLPGLYQCRIDPDTLPMSRQRIARAMGYPGRTLPAHVAEAVDTVSADLRRTARPEGGFRLFPADCREDGFSCAGHAFATGPEIAAQIARAERLALFLGTLGDGYERLRRSYQDQDEPVLGYVLDAAASEWAEQVAGQVQADLKALAKAQGMTISNRYSPGYCGWKVAEQHRLFDLLPSGFCGVTLNASAMMQPVKSVSGVIGLGRGLKYNAYRCEFCNMQETCRVRSRARPAATGEAPEVRGSKPAGGALDQYSKCLAK